MGVCVGGGGGGGGGWVRHIPDEVHQNAQIPISNFLLCMCVHCLLKHCV